MEQSAPPEAPAGIPTAAKRVLNVMRRVVKAVARMRVGDPRASLVEPQLGYCLREPEMGLQKGLGYVHGLVAIFEIVK